MENHKSDSKLVRTDKIVSEEKSESLEHFLNSNPYIALGVPENSSAKEIISAWKKLIIQHHPDKSKNPKAKEISQNLNRAVRKLVGKGGILLKYDPTRDIDNRYENSKEDNFGFPDVSDEEWYAGDEFWEYVVNNWKYTDESLKNEKEANEEKEYVLEIFKNNIYTKNDLLMPGWEERSGNNYRTFYKVGSILNDKNLINFHYKQIASQHKMRIYNSDGQIVFDGSKDSPYN